MNSLAENFGWIEIVLFALIALGFGFYQLWSVNREIAKDKRDKASPADDAGHSVGEHELDDR